MSSVRRKPTEPPRFHSVAEVAKILGVDPATLYHAINANQFQAKSDSRFHSVAAAADILGVDSVTLYRAIHAGQFPAIKIRGRYVIPARALDDMETAALNEGAVVDAARWSQGDGAVA